MWEQLMAAILVKNEVEAQKLMYEMKLEELNNTDKDGMTALILAVRKGCIDIVTNLLEKNPKLIEILYPNGSNAFHFAAQEGHVEMVKLLFNKYPALIDSVNAELWTALHFAVIRRKLEICKFLIPKMSPDAINSANKWGNTALILAANNGSGKICELLIPKMSRDAINAVKKYGYITLGDTALTLAAESGLEEICELLIPLMNPETINTRNGTGNTALICAINNRFEKICEQLIPKMSQNAINAVNNFGYTALISAVNNGLGKICELLIPLMSQEAINGVNEENETALICATKMNPGKIRELLIRKMSPDTVNAVNTPDYTALSITIYRELEKISIDLIFKMSQKAINTVSIYGYTALHFAAENNMNMVCKMLVPRRAPELVTKEKKSEIIETILKKAENDAIKLASFIIKMFSKPGNPELKLEYYHAFKLYQETNREVLKNELAKLCKEKKDAEDLIEKTDNYIIENYFFLTGISKNTILTKILTKDCIKYIMSFLSPCSLLAIDSLELDIKVKIREVLSDIQKVAATKYCEDNLSFNALGANLTKKLGAIEDLYSMGIARMMSFQAINLGIMDNEGQDLRYAIKFAKAYPELISEIALTHPEYFVLGKIAKELIRNDKALLDTVVSRLESYNEVKIIELLNKVRELAAAGQLEQNGINLKENLGTLAKEYQELMIKIANTHPECFVNVDIARICIWDKALLASPSIKSTE